MLYTVDYIPDKNIVAVKMTGRVNFQIAEQYYKEAVKTARQNNCTKFLIDYSESVSSQECNNIHTGGEEMQQFGFQSADSVAVVLKNLNDNSAPKADENPNYRWCAIKYFYKTNLQEAFVWLSENE